MPNSMTVPSAISTLTIARIGDPQQLAPKDLLSVNGLIDLYLDRTAGKSRKVLRLRKRPVQAGRGYFERVGMGDDIFHIQGCAQIAAHGLAVVQGHAGLPVDIDPQEPLRALTLKLQVPERKAEGGQDRVKELSYMVNDVSQCVPQIKRVGKRNAHPSGCSPE